MQGYAVGNHSVGILGTPQQNLTQNQFRMEENGHLSSGMGATYVAIGI